MEAPRRDAQEIQEPNTARKGIEDARSAMRKGLEHEVAALRKEIKDWQKQFLSNTGKVPTRADIKNDPNPLIWEKHQRYADLKVKLEKMIKGVTSRENCNENVVLKEKDTNTNVTPSKKRKRAETKNTIYMSPNKLKQALSKISMSPARTTSIPFPATPTRNGKLGCLPPSAMSPLSKSPFGNSLRKSPIDDDFQIGPTPLKGKVIRLLFSPIQQRSEKPSGDLLWKATKRNVRIDPSDWKRKLLNAPLPNLYRSPIETTRQRKLFDRAPAFGFGSNIKVSLTSEDDANGLLQKNDIPPPKPLAANQPLSNSALSATPTKQTKNNIHIFPSPCTPQFPVRRKSAVAKALEVEKLPLPDPLENHEDDLSQYLKEVQEMFDCQTSLSQDPLRNTSSVKKKGLKRQTRRVHMKPAPTPAPAASSTNTTEQRKPDGPNKPKKRKTGQPAGISENFVSLSYKRQEKRARGGSKFGGRFGKRA